MNHVENMFILQDDDIDTFLKLSTKEKVEAVSRAAAAQKLLKKSIKQLEQDLKASFSITSCALHLTCVPCTACQCSGLLPYFRLCSAKAFVADHVLTLG